MPGQSVGLAAEAADADFLAFEITGSFDGRRGHHAKSRHVHRRRNDDKISAGKVCLDDRWGRPVSDSNFSREHRLNDPRTAANPNDLDIETVLFEDLRFFRDERNRLRAVGFEMDEAKFGEFFLTLSFRTID